MSSGGPPSSPLSSSDPDGSPPDSPSPAMAGPESPSHAVHSTSVLPALSSSSSSASLLFHHNNNSPPPALSLSHHHSNNNLNNNIILGRQQLQPPQQQLQQEHHSIIHMQTPPGQQQPQNDSDQPVVKSNPDDLLSQQHQLHHQQLSRPMVLPAGFYAHGSRFIPQDFSALGRTPAEIAEVYPGFGNTQMPFHPAALPYMPHAIGRPGMSSGFIPDYYARQMHGAVFPTNLQAPTAAAAAAAVAAAGANSFFQKQIVKTEREIQREDALSKLEYVGRLEEEGRRYHCIRVWAARKGSVKYYDCDCGRRKAVPNLSKIKRHVQIHDVELHKCDVCGRQFKHHLGLNAHRRIHGDVLGLDDSNEVPANIPSEYLVEVDQSDESSPKSNGINAVGHAESAT